MSRLIFFFTIVTYFACFNELVPERPLNGPMYGWKDKRMDGRTSHRVMRTLFDTMNDNRIQCLAKLYLVFIRGTLKSSGAAATQKGNIRNPKSGNQIQIQIANVAPETG